MKYLNELAQAKAQCTVEGQTIFVTTEGRIRTKLNPNEKALYKVENKKGKQRVFENGKQIQPEKQGTSKL